MDSSTPYMRMRDSGPRPLPKHLSLTFVLALVVVAALTLSASLHGAHPSPVYRSLRLQNDDTTTTRKLAVRDAMRFVWTNYHTRAFGADELTPLDGAPEDNWGHVGCMILDSMDTLWIMDLHDEFEQARDWVSTSLSFDRLGVVSVFETIIRSLGGLLSTYDLTGDRVFLTKAVELADRLLPAINETTGRAFYNLDTATNMSTRPGDLAETGTYQLEFEYLSRATGDQTYAAIAGKLYPYLQSRQELQLDGLFTNDIDVGEGVITFGGGGDSFYEYLLKVSIFTGDPQLEQMYLAAIDGMEKHLLSSSSAGHAFLGDYYLRERTLKAKMAHLACFTPGLLTLGAHHLSSKDPERSHHHVAIAKELMETCYKVLYLQQPSRLAPEYVEGPELAPPSMSGYSVGYKLRPEVVESLYVMHQLTGDPMYQDWGWETFQAINGNCRTPYGFAQYVDVRETVEWSDDPDKRQAQAYGVLENKMETFFTAETLKYLYLLFDPDNRYVRLDTHVFNTEAHPLSLK